MHIMLIVCCMHMCSELMTLLQVMPLRSILHGLALTYAREADPCTPKGNPSDGRTPHCRVKPRLRAQPVMLAPHDVIACMEGLFALNRAIDSDIYIAGVSCTWPGFC